MKHRILNALMSIILCAGMVMMMVPSTVWASQESSEDAVEVETPNHNESAQTDDSLESGEESSVSQNSTLDESTLDDSLESEKNVEESSEEEEAEEESSETEDSEESEEEEEEEEEVDPQMLRNAADFYYPYTTPTGMRRAARSSRSTVTVPERYSDYTVYKGIDVSEMNGEIDWAKVKASGIDFAIIRVSGTYYRSGKLFSDDDAIKNIRNAQAAGVKVGAYHFSQAITAAEAKAEASYAVNILKSNNIQLDLPLFMDYEYVDDTSSRMHRASHMSRSEMTSYVNAFCSTVANNGYVAGVYADYSMLVDQLYYTQIQNHYLIWLAHWSSATTYPGDFKYWQYSSTGSVNGISGAVDMDVMMAKEAEDTASAAVTAYVEDSGWMATVSDGTTAGTTGEAKELQAFKITLNSSSYSDSSIQYMTDVKGTGWESNWSSNDGVSGTIGSKIYSVKIQLSGSIASDYDVYYCAHVQNLGWLGWAKNGEQAGSAGYDYRIEALRVMLVAKGDSAPSKIGSYSSAFKTKASTDNVLPTVTASYRAHVENKGWLSPVTSGTTAGTTGQSLRMEAFTLTVNTPSGYTGGVQYCGHVENRGWMNWTGNGAVCGTTGQSKRLEAVRIRLTGTLAQYYDVYYCVHVMNYGWLGWAKNGEIAGTVGQSRRAEAIRIVIVPKGSAAPSALGSIKTPTK